MSFTPETRILTKHGEVQVRDLRPGDMVKTRDNGFQELVWIGKAQMSGRALLDAPHLRPVLVRENAFGNGLPSRDTMLSPNSRVIVGKDRSTLFLNAKNALVAAKNLFDNKEVHQFDCLGTQYVQLQFDGHQVVQVNGLWVENFDLTDYSLGAIGNSQRNEISELFPAFYRSQVGDNAANARPARKRVANLKFW
ncbi:MAG: hypothetical protein ACI9ZD_001294 [Paracoccaceae bacterium]|jgi:hypothetical protein